jgi:threonine aldolase
MRSLNADDNGAPTDFRSDNVTGVAPKIMEAIIAANNGTMTSYGDDEITARVQARLAEIFETDVWIFPVATGTAANALSLASLTPSYGSVYCHREAHIEVDECGAPEFYTGGAKLVLLGDDDGKFTAAELQGRLETAHIGFQHAVQPAAVSVTQAAELGTIYSVEEIKAIGDVAKKYDMGYHMDGARFANALMTIGCTPAEMTWKAGVDVLSFGATKNGAMAAEAVVFFREDLAENFLYRRKRAGHLFSKMRFLSAQLEAYLTDDLWLDNARYSNDLASRLAAALENLPGGKLFAKVQANEIFVGLPAPVIEALEADGHLFYRWTTDGDNIVIRLVTGFSTDEDMVEAFIAAATQHSESLAAK